MPKINGVDITEPRGSSGGGFTDAIMGIFRDRTRAQQQLNMMAYGSALDVAAHVTKTELGGEAISKATQAHYDRMFGADPNSPWKSKKAQKAAQRQLSDFGLKSMSPDKVELQSVGQVINIGKGGESKAKQGPNFAKQKGDGEGEGGSNIVPKPGPQPSAPSNAQYFRGSGTPSYTPMVNETSTPINPANTGKRTPSPSKGGFAPRGRAGTYRDTAAAVKGGHITELDAVQISPTYAKKYASKVASPNLGMGDMPNG